MYSNRIFPLFIWLFWILLFSVNVQGQCGIEEQFVISDNRNNLPDTTQVSIIVSNAANNDLSSADQGLCGVRLRFSHPFMKELFFELVSPEGQTVRLTGGNIVANSTRFITWDVTFVPCNSFANPDPGFSDRWENDQNWLNFTIYNGQYYPYDGCLEDLNTGPVNGSWTIRCIDFEDGGEGRLLDATLIFCDDTGVSCTPCHLDPGFYDTLMWTGCQGDTSLDISFSKTFDIYEPDSLSYIYTNAVFSGDTLIGFDTLPRPSQWNFGEYTICGLQYAVLDSVFIPSESSRITIDSLDNYFIKQGICAALSAECIDIAISQTSIPYYLDTTICQGAYLVVGNDTLFSAGNYEIVIPKSGCDSLVSVSLSIIEMDIDIQTDNIFWSCSDTLRILRGQYDGDLPDTLNFMWSTDDGVIQSGINDSILMVSQWGTYTWVTTAFFNHLICQDTQEVTIERDGNYPEWSLASDTINCLSDSAQISVLSSLPWKDIQWSSKKGSSFTVGSEGIRTASSDTFYMIMTTENNCIVTDSVFVPLDTSFSDPLIIPDILTCFSDSVKINTTLNTDRTYTYFWPDVPGLYENEAAPWVYEGGLYTLQLTDMTNGCQQEYTVEVIEDKNPPVLTGLTSDTLSCTHPMVSPGYQTTDSMLMFVWQGPGLLSNDPFPVFTTEGDYQLTVSSQRNGCDTTLNFQVISDIILPELDISPEKLTCINDSIPILWQSDQSIDSIIWNGPNGFMSSELNPIVYNEGVYTAEVRGENGCMSYDTVVIAQSVNPPSLTFMADSLTCIRDTVQITFSDSADAYSFSWTGPGLLQDNIPKPFVIAPGIYEVSVTDPNNGCVQTDSVTVPDFRFFSEVELIIPTLNCIEDSIRIGIKNSDLKSIVYFKNNVRIEGDTSFLSEAGLYFYEFTNIFGCITRDSFELVRDDSIPSIFLEFDTFKCGEDSLRVKVASDISLSLIEWTAADGAIKYGEEVFWYSGGSHNVTLTGTNGCRNTEVFEIQYDTLPPQFSLSPHPAMLTCRDSVVVIRLVTEEPYESISWSPLQVDSDTLLVTLPGMYTATLRGINKCESSKSVTIAENRNFPSFDVQATTINCRDLTAQVRLIPEDDTSVVRWDGMLNPVNVPEKSFSFETSIPGVYYFSIENDSGCISYGSIAVTADTIGPVLNSVSVDTITCEKPCAIVRAVPDNMWLEWVWLGPDNWTLTGEDTICIQVPGQYTLEVTGVNFCQDKLDFTVVTDTLVPAVEIFTDTLTCLKDSVTIGVINPHEDWTYLWESPQNVTSTGSLLTVVLAGEYFLTATAANGCVSTKTVQVSSDVSKPQLNIGENFMIPCDSSEIQIFVSSDMPLIHYTWIPPKGVTVHSDTILTNIAGDYQVIVQGANGCVSDTVTLTVTSDNGTFDFYVESDTITCENRSVPFNIMGSLTNVTFIVNSPDGSNWNSLSNQVSTGGLYIVEARDALGCQDILEVFIPSDTLSPQFNIDSSGIILCENRSVVLTAIHDSGTENIKGEWQTSDGIIETLISENSIEVSDAGEYIFYLTNTINGCQSEAIISVVETVSDLNSLDYTWVPPLCGGQSSGTLILNPSGGTPLYTVFINDMHQGSDLVISSLSSGTYQMKISDSNGCTYEKEIILPELSDFQWDIEDTYTILFGDSLLLATGWNELPDENTISWYTNDSLLCENCTELIVSPTQNTIYRIIISYGVNCQVVREVLVQVNRQMTSAVPNIFKPESQNGNNIFYIPQIRGIEKVNYMYIFNRWSENVFKVENVLPGDMSWGWDGTFRGKDCQPGVYVVISEWSLSDGSNFVYRGDVTLVR